MFAKSKKTAAPSATPAKNMEMKKPAAAKSGLHSAPSIFSSDVTVQGTLRSDGDIQFDGHIEGNIFSDSITIGEKAVVAGEVVAENVVIRGRIKGAVRGRKVQLLSSAHVEGDILHNGLAVESGAYFDGNCRHADDPITAQMPKAPGRMKVKADAQPGAGSLAAKAGSALAS